MAVAQQISNEMYERLALAEPNRKWELLDGHLREKAGMTHDHYWIAEKLGFLLLSQLDWSVYQVRSDKSRVRRSAATYFIPDVFVLPTAYVGLFCGRSDVLEVYDSPLPLVVEVWSRSTGDYDVTEKLAAYQQRGDLEIWLVHPYEGALTAWVRQPVGRYEESVYNEGIVRPAALADVSIDLAVLFGI